MNIRMQKTHSGVAVFALVKGEKQAHMENVETNNYQIKKGVLKMIIRSVWQLGRALNLPQILSEMDVLSDRTVDNLGLYSHEFARTNAGPNDFGFSGRSKTNN